MMDMLSKVLKKKFEKGGVTIEIHSTNSKEDKKGTDLAPEVNDTQENMMNGPDDSEADHGMDFLQSMTKGDPPEMKMDRKPTLEEKVKSKMQEKMASIKKEKKK